MHSRFDRVFGWLVCATLALGACATSDSTGSTAEPRYTLVKGESTAAAHEGLSPDKQSDIMMMLGQRQPTAQKCYQDALNEKNDRGFQGTVAVVIQLAPGAKVKVRVSKSTLNSPEVEQCLVGKIAEFEFPAVEQAGDMQYEYLFRPAY